MTITEAINRAYNLLGVAIVALHGIAVAPVFFVEDELTHKLDEGLLFLLGIGAIVWYVIGKNKFSRSLVPILLVAAALVIKLIAFIFLEAGDAADLGDEFGAIVLFALGTGLLIWQYVSTKRLAEKSVQEKEPVAP